MRETVKNFASEFVAEQSPAVSLIAGTTAAEAIQRASRSKYALGATTYTVDLNEAVRAVEEIEAGRGWIHAPLLDNDAGFFEGRKQSGMGR